MVGWTYLQIAGVVKCWAKSLLPNFGWNCDQSWGIPKSLVNPHAAYPCWNDVQRLDPEDRAASWPPLNPDWTYIQMQGFSNSSGSLPSDFSKADWNKLPISKPPTSEIHTLPTFHSNCHCMSNCVKNQVKTSPNAVRSFHYKSDILRW